MRERGGKGGQRYQERDDGVWLDQLLVAHGGAELVCKGDNSGTNSAKSALERLLSVLCIVKIQGGDF